MVVYAWFMLTISPAHIACDVATIPIISMMVLLFHCAMPEIIPSVVFLIVELILISSDMFFIHISFFERSVAIALSVAILVAIFTSDVDVECSCYIRSMFSAKVSFIF